MQCRIKYYILFTMFLILIACNHILVHGEEVTDEMSVETSGETIKTASGETSDEGKPLAVVLVIDTSGSMKDTDSDKLRQQAASIFIDLLSPEDYVGIITFNDKVSVVTPMKQVKSSDHKLEIKKKLISYMAEEGNTNYRDALEEALNQLSLTDSENVSPAIVFITDGEPDPEGKGNHDTKAMKKYMSTLWKTVDKLAVKNYPVYSIGFSDGIRSDVLERISSNTRGEFQIYKNSGSIAFGFFRILDKLKKRTNFISETIELSEKDRFTFSIDRLTRQVTMAILGNDLTDVTLIGPMGESGNGAANIVKNNTYTLITLNSSDINAFGNWKVVMKGKGIVQVFGSKDMIIETLILSPSENNRYLEGEPVEIQVLLGGKLPENIRVEALVKGKNKVKAEEVDLEEANGILHGVFRSTENRGIYTLEVNVLLWDELIASKTVDFHVGILPSISQDFYIQEEGFQVGEETGITSYLTMEGLKLNQGVSLRIDDYYAYISNIDGTYETFPLYDDGLPEHGDLAAEDNIWTTHFIFSKESLSQAYLVVRGTYNNEDFMIIEYLGSYKVSNPGGLEVITTGIQSEILSAIKGRNLILPIMIKNKSSFTETLNFTLNTENLGTLRQNKIVLTPGEEKLVSLDILINKKLNIKNEDNRYLISIGLQSENQRTKLNTDTLEFHAEIISKTQSLLLQFKSLWNTIWIPVTIILGVIGITLIPGRILCKVIFNNNKIIRGILTYRPTGSNRELEASTSTNMESESIKSTNIDLSELRKTQITISFDDSNTKADYYIKGSKYKYDMVIQWDVQIRKQSVAAAFPGKRKQKGNTGYKVTVTPPGIMERTGQVFTTMDLVENDTFESGGYLFRYTKGKSRA